MKCPKCEGEMEEGYILDAGMLGTAASQQQRWLKGNGLKEGDVVITGTSEGFTVRTFRCKNCKYLESYTK